MTLVAPSALFSLGMAPDARSRAIDATSTDPWGPSRALMEDLRADTLTRDSADVLHVLHEALLSNDAQWRRVLKALTTIAYCLREGSNEVATFALAHGALISQLTHFEFHDAYRLDRGAAVREEAQAVAQMLQLNVSQSELPGAGASTSACRTRHEPPPPPPRHPAQMSFFSAHQDPPPLLESDDPFSETERLAGFIRRVELSSDDEDTWLNIYKLLFLVHNALPNAPDAEIRSWAQHTHLFAHLARWRPRADSIAPDVRRLAAELVGLFDGGARASEIRRRARMF